MTEIIIWQARINGSKYDDAWRTVTPTKHEKTVEDRVRYLRMIKRDIDGEPAYEFRALCIAPVDIDAVLKPQ